MKYMLLIQFHHNDQWNFFLIYFLKKNKDFLWLYLKACGIWIPQSGVKPALPALEVQSLNH